MVQKHVEKTTWIDSPDKKLLFSLDQLSVQIFQSLKLFFLI